LRDRAMMELLYASGLRISELANARLENFNSEERVVRVTGKGNSHRHRRTKYNSTEISKSVLISVLTWPGLGF